MSSAGSKRAAHSSELSSESRYKLWRRYIPVLYDFISSRVFDWPASCVQFIDINKGSWRDILDDLEWKSGTRLVLAGCYSGNSKEDSLELFQTEIPKPCNYDFDPDSSLQKVISNNRVRTREIASVPHDDEVLAAKCMPQNSSVVASRSISSVFVYNFSVSVSEPKKVVLSNTQGMSLAWSPISEGRLLVGNDSGSVSVIRADRSSRSKKSNETTLSSHTDSVLGLDWHPCDENLFASASQDGSVSMSDLRSKSASFNIKNAHGTEYGVNCIAFNPTEPHLLLSGVGWREDDTNEEMIAPNVAEVRLWDVRKIDAGSIHIFATPTSHVIQEDLGVQVYQVRWNPSNTKQFGACSGDGAVRVWDISKTGSQFETEDDAEDGPPELAFVHSGHTDAVSDFQWDNGYKNTLVSVADDNICMFWRPLY